MNIQPKATLTFSKCLEMKLDSHVDAIAKVAEVASKEFSIEQVCKFTEPLLNAMSLYQNVCGILIFRCTLCEMLFVSNQIWVANRSQKFGNFVAALSGQLLLKKSSHCRSSGDNNLAELYSMYCIFYLHRQWTRWKASGTPYCWR